MQELNLIEIEAVSGAGGWIPGGLMGPEGGWVPGSGMAPQGGWVPGA